MMGEVHRYKALELLSPGGTKFQYYPQGLDVVFADELDRVTAERDALQSLLTERDEQLDAQRLRADTAEAELKAIKESIAYRGSLFGKVQAERDAAEQRNSELVELLRMMKDNGGYLDEQEWERIEAALNPSPEAESHELAKG